MSCGNSVFEFLRKYKACFYSDCNHFILPSAMHLEPYIYKYIYIYIYIFTHAHTRILAKMCFSKCEIVSNNFDLPVRND